MGLEEIPPPRHSSLYAALETRTGEIVGQTARLPIPFVANRAGFPVVRRVGVPVVVALMSMMFQMISAKPHRAGSEVRQIGDDRASQCEYR